MGRHRHLALLGGLLLAGVVAAAAGASTSASRPAGSPDLAAMALAASDFPTGTRVESQGYYRDPDFVASYQREFEARGGRLGRTRLLGAFVNLDVDRTAASARQTFGFLAQLFRGKQGALLLRASIVEEDIDPKDVVIGKIRRPKIGQGALVIPLRLRVSGVWFEFALAFVRFDRVLGGVGLFGMPGGKVFPADIDRITRVAVARVKAGLVPVNTLAPAVAGVVEPGQTLSATPGTWTGDQLTFAYQWERCETTGEGCAAIPGATSATYAIVTGDLASTVRVTVTGRNRLGSVTSSSAPTGLVSGPAGAPTNAALPTVSGTAQVGSTLTAEPGTWTGGPTAFSYQWRRCNTSGAACVDIAGATTASYAVTPSDSGGTLRVLVVASNAIGPGGAVAAPTVTVP